jgi:hypothetical protein
MVEDMYVVSLVVYSKDARIMPLLSERLRFSRYLPGCTKTTSPLTASLIALWITEYCCVPSKETCRVAAPRASGKRNRKAIIVLMLS